MDLYRHIDVVINLIEREREVFVVGTRVVVRFALIIRR